MRIAVAGCLLVCLVPSAQAQLLFGDEEVPELPDGVDDVAYDPLYVGDMNHAYIDFAAAWFAYDEMTDEIEFTMKTASGNLAAAPDGWNVICGAGGNVTAGGETMGELRYIWSIDSNESEPHGFVTFRSTQQQAVGVGEGNPGVKSTFSADLQDAGYFRFRVARSALLILGDGIETPNASCAEYFELRTPVSRGPLMANRDFAESEAAYSFTEHRRVRAPDGAVDPIERLPTDAPTAPASSQSETSTPTIGFLGVLTGLLVVAVVARRP